MPAGDVAHMHLSERGSFLREGSLLALAHRRGLVTVATIHGASFLPFARRSSAARVAAVLRRADLVTCLDRETLELVRHRAPGVRCELLPNPVLVDDRCPTGGRAPTSWSCSPARSALRKGADVLARAWPRGPTAAPRGAVPDGRAPPPIHAPRRRAPGGARRGRTRSRCAGSCAKPAWSRCPRGQRECRWS